MPERASTTRGESRGWRNSILRLALTVLLLIFIYSVVPVAGVLDALAAADLRWIALAWLLSLTHVFLTALQLRILTATQGLSASVPTLVAINLAAAFYGLFLPGYLAGGVVRWIKLARLDGRPIEAFVVVSLNRLVDTVVLVAVGAGFLLVERGGFGTPALVSLGGLLLATVAAYLFLFRGAAAELVERGSARFGTRPAATLQRLSVALSRGRDLPPRGHAGLVLLSLVRTIVDLAGAWLFVRGLGLELGLISLGWIRTVVRLATLLPISFSGLGVRDSSLVILTQPYGVAAAGAAALAALLFSRGLIQALLGACVEGARLWRAPALAAPGTSDGRWS